jgi:Holliday junction resolvase RusA-like endonuclease
MSTIVLFGLFGMVVAIAAWFARRVREARAAQIEYDRRRDLNWSKQVKDAINGSDAVWWDDSQVRQEFWYMAGVDKENPGATVTVVLLPDVTP